jgi:hypothetical protein
MSSIRVGCLAALFVCLFTNTYSQSLEDYVVTVANDTLYGEVKLNTYMRPKESVTLKDSQKKKKDFTPNNARAFRIKDKLYQSVLLRDHYAFMEVLESGHLSLYEHQSGNSTSSATEIDTYIKIDMGELVQIPKIGFRKKIIPLLSQCPSLNRKVEDKTYGFTDLKTIAQEYNQCVVSQPKKQRTSVTASIPESAPATQAASVQSSPATPQTALIGELLNYLEKNPQVNNQEDLRSCLNDIAAKVKAGSTVPKYLLDALVNLSKPVEDIREKAQQLATGLGYRVEK